MSVRRTVARSSAGLLLVAAFAVGPAVAFGEAPAAPGGPSDGGGECVKDSDGDYIPVLSISASTASPGETVELVASCLPERGPVTASIVLPDGGSEEPEGGGVATPGGQQVWTYSVANEAKGGEYSFVLSMESGWSDNRTFTVVVEDDGEGDGDNGSVDTEGYAGDDSAESDENGDHSGSDDNGQEQDDDEGAVGNGSDTGGNAGTGDSGTDDQQGTGSGDDGGGEDQGTDGSGGNAGDGDDAGQDSDQADDRNSGDDSQQEDSSEDGDTSASAGGEDSAGRKPAPQQPPAAPGSATNDFPAATPEATADQKQSAALAVLMTNLFAGGVSSGEVGTTPDKARTIIDPSADASEIEVPAESSSDAGGTSEASTGSGASDSDALAATGSNMLVPAGIAGLALLAGAGLKISQIRRDR